MLTVVWDKCSVDKPTGKDDAIGRPMTEAVTLNRGDALPDYVSDFNRSVLVMIGAVRDLQVIVQQAQENMDAQLRPDPAPGMYPPEVPVVDATGTVVTPDTASTGTTTTDAAATSATATGTTTDGSTGATPVKPQVSDGKDLWETYAVDSGYLTRPEAEAMTKTKLVADVNKRESN